MLKTEEKQGYLGTLALHIKDEKLFYRAIDTCTNTWLYQRTNLDIYIAYDFDFNQFIVLKGSPEEEKDLHQYGFVLSLLEVETEEALYTFLLEEPEYMFELVRDYLLEYIQTYYTYTFKGRIAGFNPNDEFEAHHLSYDEVPPDFLAHYITDHFEADKNMPYSITPAILAEMKKLGRYGRYPDNLEEVKVDILRSSYITCVRKTLLLCLPAKIFTDEEYQLAVCDAYKEHKTKYDKETMLDELKKRSKKHYNLFLEQNKFDKEMNLIT